MNVADSRPVLHNARGSAPPHRLRQGPPGVWESSASSEVMSAAGFQGGDGGSAGRVAGGWFCPDSFAEILEEHFREVCSFGAIVPTVYILSLSM